MAIEVFMHPNSELCGTYETQIEAYRALWLIRYLNSV